MIRFSNAPSGRHFLQIPGPTNVPDRILRAIDHPTIDHRGPEFGALCRTILAGLKTVFKTNGDVVIYPGGEGPFGASAFASGGPNIRTTGLGSDDYEQSLGYYPRGATSLGLIDAVAGLVLDVPGGALYTKPATYPLRVPVLSLADWDEPDPSKRVPTIYFPNSSASPSIANRSLLPTTVDRDRTMDISSISGVKHALSPNGDGINESVTVDYEVPVTSQVSNSVWEGSERVRSWLRSSQSGVNSITWDGKTNSGSVLGDGIYTARIDAQPASQQYAIRPASSEIWVNNSIPNVASDWYHTRK